MNNTILYNYMYQKAFLKQTPLSVMIELLTQCNLKCKHCYIPDHSDSGISFDKITDILREFKDLGGLNVSLTGGEIFLRSDLFEIIEYIRSLHMRVILLSNGTLVDYHVASALSKLNIAQFSTTVFSMDENIHDKITQTPGSLQKTLSALSLLKRAGVKVQVKTPLMKANMNEFREIKRYCIQNGFLFRVSPLIFEKLDGDKSPLDLRIPLEDLKKILPEIDNETREKHIYVNESACGALHFSFAIDCNGYVYPCNSFHYKVGNIYEKSLSEIWYNSSELKYIRNIKKVYLTKCSHCDLQAECDRCPGMAYNNSGHFYGCDEFARSLAEIRLNR